MIFGPDLLVVLFVLIFLLGFLGISIWAIVDVSSHSKEDFDSAGSSKTAWIIVISVFTVFYGCGSLIAIYYLLVVRPKVLRVEGQALDGGVAARRSDARTTGLFCENCGTPFSAQGKFCSSCGMANLS
jgi:general stress protein CsbA